MPDESIKVVIGADVSQGVAGINQFNRALTQVKPGATSATFALTNLGRVAQDLPFGFIGIANNLNPLLESFQRLRQESGSNIGALKALGSSLIGGGGLGLALSVVTALLSFASVGFSAWTRGMHGAKEATDEFKKSLKDVAVLQNEALSSVQGQIATVRALGQVITDTNRPYAERKRALEELKETNKSYFGDLTLESAKLAILAARIQDYTKALVQQAIVKKFADAIADTAEAVGKQEQAVEKARTAVTQLNKEFEKQQKLGQQTPQRGALFAGENVNNAFAINKAAADLLAAQKKLTDENEKLTTLDVQRIDQTNVLNTAVEAGLKLRDLESTKVKEIRADVEAISHAHILNPKDLELAQKIHDTINGIRQPEKQTAFNGAAPTTTPLLPINEASFFKPLSDAEKALDDFNANLAVQMQAMKATLIEGFAEAFGTLAGGGGFHQALASFLSIIGTALEAIGKSAVEAGLAILTVKKALTALITNPYLLVAAGAAAIAVGAAIKAHVPKFAAGGIATKPTLGIFGEAGPEALIPLNKMDHMGGSMPAFVELRLKGRDAVGLIDMNRRSLNRIT